MGTLTLWLPPTVVPPSYVLLQGLLRLEVETAHPNINSHHLHFGIAQMAHLSARLCSTLHPSLYASRLMNGACRACPTRTRRSARRDLSTVQAAGLQLRSMMTPPTPRARTNYGRLWQTGNASVQSRLQALSDLTPKPSRPATCCLCLAKSA